MLLRFRLFALLVSLAWIAEIGHAQLPEVNLYSYREPERILPLLRALHASTGIRVNLTFASKDLIERIAEEGDQGPADVLLTNEFSLLLDARKRGLTQPLKSAAVEANVPSIYRDPEGHWTGLARRARVLVISTTRVNAAPGTYEELADPKWKGRLCIRSGSHPYNTALVASMLVHHGSQKAELWLRGLKSNLARPPKGGDRDQVRAVIEGACDIAIVNSYYAANFIQIDQELREQKHKSIRLVFPNAEGRGTHVTISGAALMKHARNREGGIKLIELLTSELGQRMLSAVNDEYPVTDLVAPPTLLGGWAALRPDPLPLHKLAERRTEAKGLVEAIRFDDGPNDSSSPMR